MVIESTHKGVVAAGRSFKLSPAVLGRYVLESNPRILFVRLSSLVKILALKPEECLIWSFWWNRSSEIVRIVQTAFFKDSGQILKQDVFCFSQVLQLETQLLPEQLWGRWGRCSWVKRTSSWVRLKTDKFKQVEMDFGLVSRLYISVFFWTSMFLCLCPR